MKKNLSTILQTNSTARKLLASKDIAFFARYYLNNHARSPLGQLHREWFETVLNNKKIAIAAPRGHAKSSVFTLIYPLWCILFQKKKYIIIISDSDQQAADLLGGIIEELETNERILRDFGKIAGYVPQSMEEKRKWSSKEIITLTDIKVVGRGIQTRLRGTRYKANRPDLIILDDVENDENVQSELQRQKIRNVFGKSILNLGSQTEAQIIVIGTILHFDSLLNNIIKNPGDGWYVKLYRAIENNEPIWPEWWTMEMFEEKKNDPMIGTIGFEQEYMNNPLDPSQQILIPKHFYEGEVDLSMVDIVGYLDPAISEKDTADYSAICLLGKHRNENKIFVVHVERLRGSITTVVQRIIDLHKRFRILRFGVETVAFQKAVAQIIQKEAGLQQVTVALYEHEPDKDKIRRATSVSGYTEQIVYFNNAFIDFMTEIMQFPKGDHDDMVDAYVGAMQLALMGSSGTIAVGSNLRPNSY